ncbi:hypothetical protein G6F24_016772 [Rhizopus arrhizus]|nr:hypothetical protein G6F24_016772 [Rhizopus arrhizus]
MGVAHAADQRDVRMYARGELDFRAFAAVVQRRWREQQRGRIEDDQVAVLDVVLEHGRVHVQATVQPLGFHAYFIRPTGGGRKRRFRFASGRIDRDAGKSARHVAA